MLLCGRVKYLRAPTHVIRGQAAWNSSRLIVCSIIEMQGGVSVLEAFLCVKSVWDVVLLLGFSFCFLVTFFD